MTQTLDRLERQVTEAQAVLNEHDRPFHRRGHKHEIADANATLDHAAEAGVRFDRERAEIAAKLETTNQQLAAAKSRQPERDALTAELDHINRALARDLDNRARQLRERDDLQVIRFGSRPNNPAHAHLWDRAVAHQDRYQTMFPEPTRNDPLEFRVGLAARDARHELENALDQQRGLHLERSRGMGISM